MLVTLFYHIDNFCQNFYKAFQLEIVNSNIGLIESRLNTSEIMTIMVYYHYSGYKTFKDYYTKHVLIYLKSEFKNKLVSYNRFVELQQKAIAPLSLFLKLCCIGTCTGTSFIDSFPLKVCHNKRIHSHRVFKDKAQRGKTSVGWFYGFKVHLIINEYGEVVEFYITSGNVADNNEEVLKQLTENVFGKVYGDKGYLINTNLFGLLYSNGVHLITKIKSNMNNKLMDFQDKLMLKKRGLIDSAIHILKDILSIEHTRHRSPVNFLANLLSGLIAYSFYQTKPTIVVYDTISIPSF